MRRVLTEAASVSNEYFGSVASGFCQVTLVTGRAYRGRVTYVDEHTAVIGERSESEYPLHVAIAHVVSFEYADPTIEELRELGEES